jgi:hypothetical protein
MVNSESEGGAVDADRVHPTATIPIRTIRAITNERFFVVPMGFSCDNVPGFNPSTIVIFVKFLFKTV